MRPSRSVPTVLAIILAAGLLLRLMPIVAAAMSPPFSLGDPDGYARSAVYVADHPGQWMWVRDVVQFAGTYLKAPLYPAMLCAFAVVWPGGFPLTAALFQVLLATASGLAVFRMGQHLHSARAGLIATALYMVYLPNFGSQLFGQEGLFIPLSLAAMALHIECVVSNARLRTFALLGVLYGLTALTRSLPLYFLPLIAALQIYWSLDRRRGTRQAAVLLAVFFCTMLPYSVYISSKWHQWVFVDTQGMRAIVDRYSPNPDVDRPGMVDAVTMVANAVIADPAREIQDRVSLARAFFYLRGGQWLQVDAPGVATAAEAWLLKAFAHLTYDLPSAFIFLAAPLGFAFARNRRSAVIISAWPLIALALMIAFLWSGGRYTASFLPQLMLGASVVLAGAWHRPRRRALALALLCTAVVAIPVCMSAPLTAWGRANYGARFRYDSSRTLQQGTMAGEAGFSVITDQGRVQMTLTPTGTQLPAETGAWMEIRADGARQKFVRCISGRSESVSIDAAARLVFVEVRMLSSTGAALPTPVPVAIEISVGRAARAQW